MSSKVIRSSHPVDAVPIAWRHTSGPTVQTAHPRPDSGGGGAHAEPEGRVEARVHAAYQQGHAAGEAAMTQRAFERLDPILASLQAILQELAGMRKRFRMEAEQDTVKLAVAIARRVLHRELATDPEAILGLVMATFQKLNARETYRLRVSPGDATVLEENRARMELPQGFEIAADPLLATGSAIFETSRGELDASVDTQLAEIQRGFADIIRRRPA